MPRIDLTGAVRPTAYMTNAAALQLELDKWGSEKSAALHLPGGVIEVDETLRIRGGVSYGVKLAGELGGTRGPGGTVLAWVGAADGVVLETSGLNGSTIEDIEIDGRGMAKDGLHIKYDAARNEPSSGNVVRRITVGGVRRACVALGADPAADPPNTQASEIDFYSCVLVGGEAGIRTLTGGNTKNFRVFGGSITYQTQYGIDWANASGTFLVEGVTFAAIALADIRHGVGSMKVSGCESENNLVGGRFIVGGSVGDNAGGLTVDACNWNGIAPSDDVVIDYGGNITIIGCELRNGRTTTSPPFIRCGTLLGDGSGVVSLNNFYEYASALPLVDGSGNPLVGSDYARDRAVRVFSFGDYSRRDQGPRVALPAVVGGLNIQNIEAFEPIAGVGVAWLGSGEIRRAQHRVTLDHRAFVGGGTVERVLFRPRPGERIARVVAETSQAYAGAPNPTLRVGKTYDGEEYIASHAVDVTGRADSGPIDDIPSWTAHEYLRVQARCSSGGLSALTAGSTTFRITTELLK